jgi:hypothetical protein
VQPLLAGLLPDALRQTRELSQKMTAQPGA